MKTIKFFLTGVLSLFVTLLLLRYAVLSLSYMTNEFTTIDSKDIYNFGFTFAIQAIILVALAFSTIAISVSCFQLTSKYYKIGAKAKRERQLLKHIEDEKYNELITKLRSTNDISTKSRYIDEYLGKKVSFGEIIRSMLSKIEADDNFKGADYDIDNNKIVRERDTFDDNVQSTNDVVKAHNDQLSKDLFPKQEVQFEPKDMRIHKD